MAESQELPHNEHVADATVVEDEPIKVWRDGLSTVISSRELASWQAQGWLSNTPDDVSSLVASIDLLAEQVKRNVHEYIDGVRGDGVIDTRDAHSYAAAHAALSQLVDVCGTLDVLVHSVWPVRQEEPAIVVHAGTEVAYDPSQVPMIDAEGNLRAVDPETAESLKTAGWKEHANA